MVNANLLTHFKVARAWMEQPCYKTEVEYYRNLRPEHVTREVFFNEYRHVVFAAGYSNRNLKALAPRLTRAFRDYDIAAIAVDPYQVRCAALGVFNHEGKVGAIVFMAEYLAHNGWGRFKVRLTGPSHLAEIVALDRIGNVTKYHLARNIGLDYAKPDRLMRRIAKEFGYTDSIAGVSAMVAYLQKATGERPGVIDIILWRYEE